MIKRSLIIFLCAFAGYTMLIYLVKPSTSKGQNQWQSNVIRAQEFVYGNAPLKCVLVGSSLSYRISQDYLPKGYNNLSFSGGSAFTGLEILKKCERLPKIIAIEINVINRPTEDDFLANLFMPVLKDARKTLPSLQEKNQPVNLLAPLLMTSKAKPQSTSKPSAELYQSLLKEHLKELNKSPDTSILSQIKKLQEYVSYFKNLGVKILFYDMPVDSQITHAKIPSYIRTNMISAFPQKDNLWLQSGVENAYTFTDGEHLDAESGRKFTQWFVAEINKAN